MLLLTEKKKRKKKAHFELSMSQYKVTQHEIYCLLYVEQVSY